MRMTSATEFLNIAKETMEKLNLCLLRSGFQTQGCGGLGENIFLSATFVLCVAVGTYQEFSNVSFKIYHNCFVLFLQTTLSKNYYKRFVLTKVTNVYVSSRNQLNGFLISTTKCLLGFMY